MGDLKVVKNLSKSLREEGSDELTCKDTTKNLFLAAICFAFSGNKNSH